MNCLKTASSYLQFFQHCPIQVWERSIHLFGISISRAHTEEYTFHDCEVGTLFRCQPVIKSKLLKLRDCKKKFTIYLVQEEELQHHKVEEGGGLSMSHIRF